MTDKISKKRRSANMRAVKSRNTAPERKVRSLIHKMGYRFRLHGTDLAGTPDLVFPGKRAVIFVHGCFWHGHHCRRGRLKPENNADFWKKKLESNRKRDLKQQRRLRKDGWKALIVWECQINKTPTLIRKIKRFLR